MVSEKDIEFVSKVWWEERESFGVLRDSLMVTFLTLQFGKVYLSV